MLRPLLLSIIVAKSRKKKFVSRNRKRNCLLGFEVVNTRVLKNAVQKLLIVLAD